MISPLVILDVLWAAWLLTWLLAAQATAKTVVRQSSTSRLTHAVLIWGGAMLLFLRPAWLGSLQRAVLPPTAWAAWAGVLLAGAGLGFAEWARVHLGRFWSSAVTLKAGHALIRTGPYGLTRHPIYTGLLLAFTGTALARDSVAGLLGLVLAAAGIVVKIRQEERLLLAHFGSDYQAYRAGVPALLPRL